MVSSRSRRNTDRRTRPKSALPIAMMFDISSFDSIDLMPLFSSIPCAMEASAASEKWLPALCHSRFSFYFTAVELGLIVSCILSML